MVEGAKMILPKLTVVGNTSDIPGDEIISVICEKDEQPNQLGDSGKTLEVVKCFDEKIKAGGIQHKKAPIECSPEIRSYIMIRNGGYICVGLCRCKVYVRYFVPLCFHCNEFNHYANTCPNKSDPAKCGKFAGEHKTENCRSKLLKCLNCVKAKVCVRLQGP